MISSKDAKKWLAELAAVGAELGTISARLKVLEEVLESIREKIL